MSLAGMLRLYRIIFMYNDCETLVSTRARDTASVPLFILIMDVQQAEIGKEPQRVMLFAYDLVR